MPPLELPLLKSWGPVRPVCMVVVGVQDYTITIYLNQYWTDERLSFSDDDDDNMTLTGDFTEKIWVPDTFFANDKLSFLHTVTEKNHMIRLYGDGSVVYGMRSALSLSAVSRVFVASFLPRDATLARYVLSSPVTNQCSSKTAKRRIVQTTPHDSPGL